MGSARQLLLFSRQIKEFKRLPATAQEEAGGIEVRAHIKLVSSLLSNHLNLRPLKRSSGRNAEPRPSKLDSHSPLFHRRLPRQHENLGLGSVGRALLARTLIRLPRKDPSPSPLAPLAPFARGWHRIALVQRYYLLVGSRLRHRKERVGEGGATGHVLAPGSVCPRSRGEASRNMPPLAFPRRLRLALKKQST